MQMINISTQILKFRNFLVHSWNDLDLLMENHDWDNDVNFLCEWLQVNWEFLVERELLEKKGFLQPYIFLQSRVTYPNSVMTHWIVCRSKLDQQLTDDATGITIPENAYMIFNGFEEKMNSGYGWYPPFDYVAVFTKDRKQHFQISVDAIDFLLYPVENGQ